jgi:hypothetical protein
MIEYIERSQAQVIMKINLRLFLHTAFVVWKQVVGVVTVLMLVVHGRKSLY